MRLNLHKTARVQVTFALALTLIAFASCKDNDVYNPQDPSEPIEVDQFFDYSTEKEIQLSINYEAPASSQVRYEVFAKNPLVEYTYQGEDGETYVDYRRSSDATAIAGGFTKKGGKDNVIIKVPASANELYFLSNDAGVPTLCKVAAQSGSYELTFDNSLTRALASQSILDERTELITSYTLKGSYNGKNNLNIIYDEEWYTNGAPKWSVIEELNEDILEAYQVLRTSKVITSDGKKYYSKSADFLSRYLLKKDFEVANNGEVKLQVIGTYCSMNNTLAYFVYDQTPQTLDELNEIKKYMILPLAKAQDAMSAPKALVSPKGDNIESETVYLINPEDGTRNFKAGTKIGFVLFPSSYAYSSSNPSKNTTPTISYSDKPNYSTAIEGQNFINLNADPVDQNLFGFAINYNNPCQTVASIKVKNMDYYEIFGFEDQKGTATDTDFDDLVFGVSNIKGTEETGDPLVTFEKQGLLLFEDEWPKTGDYDMNDVITQYHITHSVNNKNELVESDYTFKLLWAGATYHNSFNILLPNSVKSIKDLGAEEGIERLANDNIGATNGRYVSICSDILDFFTIDGPKLEGSQPSYHFKAIFNEGVDREVSNEFNPFITSNANVEIHLIGQTPSSLMLEDATANVLFNTQNDKSKTPQEDNIEYWYAGANYLPFSLNMVDTDGSVLALDFYKTVKESTGIDKVFPKFTSWANREAGYENVEWWK